MKTLTPLLVWFCHALQAIFVKAVLAKPSYSASDPPMTRVGHLPARTKTAPASPRGKVPNVQFEPATALSCCMSSLHSRFFLTERAVLIRPFTLNRSHVLSHPDPTPHVKTCVSMPAQQSTIA
jgi:hypothetical protein